MGLRKEDALAVLLTNVLTPSKQHDLGNLQAHGSLPSVSPGLSCARECLRSSEKHYFFNFSQYVGCATSELSELKTLKGKKPSLFIAYCLVESDL